MSTAGGTQGDEGAGGEVPVPARTPGDDPVAERPVSAREASQAWESLFRAQVALMRRFGAEDVWSGMSVREYDVLYALSLAEHGTVRLRDLGESSLLTQPSLSRLVERLERDGLVARGPVAGDARGVAVTLTDAGRRVQREIGHRHAESIRRLVGGALSRSELADLRRLTDKLRAAQADLP